jgi:hypothetical protein
MSGPFYISAGGDFPSQSSQPVFITESEFYDCCCGTGCFCFTVMEWSCVANDWELVDSGKADFITVLYFPRPPYDQWNYFYLKRNSPRSETIIRAIYGTWIDCSESCPTPSDPATPPAAWTDWKCDEEEPETPPVDAGSCQKLAIYTLDCEVPEWILDEVQIIGAIKPAGTVIMQPDEVTFWVYGRVFDCDDEAQPPDPGPPGETSKYCYDIINCTNALDEYELSGWFQYLDFFSGDATCDPSNLGVESEKRIKDAAAVTLSRTTGCEWTASFQIENRNVNGTPTAWALYASGATFTATLSYSYTTRMWKLYVNLLEVTGTRIWKSEWPGNHTDPTTTISEAYDCGLAGALYTTGSKEALIS